MTDHEAYARLREVIRDWRSGILPSQGAIGAVGEVLGLPAEPAPGACEGPASPAGGHVGEGG